MTAPGYRTELRRANQYRFSDARFYFAATAARIPDSLGGPVAR